MKNSLLSVARSFALLLCLSTVAWAQNPSFVTPPTPVAGSTVSTDGFQVRVQPGAGANANYSFVEIINQTSGVRFRKSGNYYGSSPFTYTVPTGLAANTSYLIRATTVSRAGTRVIVERTVVTGAAEPRVVPVFITPPTPVDNAFISSLSGFQVRVQPGAGANANYSFVEVINLSTDIRYRKSGNYSGTNPFTYSVAAGLAPSTQYLIRATTVSRSGVSTIAERRIRTSPPVTTQIVAIDGQTAGAAPVYANNLDYVIEANLSDGADEYDWQIATDAAFSDIIIDTTTSDADPNVLRLRATQLGGGDQYYVRARARNSTITTPPGNFSTGRAFYNALYPIQLESPRGTVDRLSFRLRTNLEDDGLDTDPNDVADNPNEWIFQVAIADTDGDPSNDFDPGKIFSNTAPYRGNSTRPFITGNVFIANDYRTFPSGVQLDFNYMRASPGVAYKVRVRAARRDANGNYLQTGYWGEVVTFRVSNSARRMDVAGATTASSEASLLFPSPFSNNAQLRINPAHAEVAVRVTDMLGRSIEERAAQGGQTLTVGDRWKTGTYIIQIRPVEGVTQPEVLRVIKQ